MFQKKTFCCHIGCIQLLLAPTPLYCASRAPPLVRILVRHRCFECVYCTATATLCASAVRAYYVDAKISVPPPLFPAPPPLVRVWVYYHLFSEPPPPRRYSYFRSFGVVQLIQVARAVSIFYIFLCLQDRMPNHECDGTTYASTVLFAATISWARAQPRCTRFKFEFELEWTCFMHRNFLVFTRWVFSTRFYGFQIETRVEKKVWLYPFTFAFSR